MGGCCACHCSWPPFFMASSNQPGNMLGSNVSCGPLLWAQLAILFWQGISLLILRISFSSQPGWQPIVRCA